MFYEGKCVSPPQFNQVEKEMSFILKKYFNSSYSPIQVIILNFTTKKTYKWINNNVNRKLNSKRGTSGLVHKLLCVLPLSDI